MDCLYLIFIFFLFCFSYSSNKNPVKVLPPFEKKTSSMLEQTTCPGQRFQNFFV